MYSTFLEDLKEFNKSMLPSDSSEVLKWYRRYCGLFYLFMYAKGRGITEETDTFLMMRRFRNMMEHSWPEGKKQLEDLKKMKRKISLNQHLVAKELKEVCDKLKKI